MPTLYDYQPSGNGYKVRMLLAWLGLPYRYVEVDITRGETRTPEFLAKNANGKVPVLELEDGTCLAESNAILWYLAEGTPFLPHDRLQRAQVLQWLFFEQYSHEPNVATVRYWITHGFELTPWRRETLEQKRAQGYAALDVMEARLRERNWLVGDAPSIADVSLYGYTHVADEGGFELARYPAVRAWLARVAAQPGEPAVTARYRAGAAQ